jgi:dipeptidyl aminopeptidase/acylaminoacyl peptidase
MSGVQAAPLPDAVSVETFAAPPAIEGAQLSPDGTKIAAKLMVGGKQRLVMLPIGGGKPLSVDTGTVDVNWWDWVNDEWLVVGIGDSQVVYSYDVYVTRLLGLKADMSEMVQIDWKRSGLDADDLLWTARDGSPRIIFQKHTGIGDGDWDPSVFEADVSTGKVRKMVGGRSEIYQWFADADGNVRLGAGQDSRERNYFVYRTGNDGGFQRAPKVFGVDDEAPIPLIYNPDGTAVVIAESDGFYGVHKMSLPSFDLGAKLHSVPGYDVGGIVANPSYNGVDGVHYVDQRSRVQWLNPSLQQIQKELDAAFGPGNAHIVSWSRDRQRMLVEVGSPSQAGGLYLWDARGGMQHLGWNNSTLKGRALSPVKTVRYKARDGTPIEAVLTLPRGREAKDLPLIVLPHGGPQVRDSESFDWWVQFLAEQGYAVIQPNYRGSSGYGSAFQDLGEGQWGLKMQDDLIDAIDWTASEGIADPKRVCIVGASYGGYAAMRGAQRDNGRYRCAISYAGVSDLGAMMKYDRKYLFGSKTAKAYWKKQTPDFASVSPRLHAAQFSAPILIAHGAEDKRVPVKQSRMLAEELRKAGKPFEYLEQKEGDHHFSRTEDRLEFLKAMKAFLDRYNPA